MPRIRRSNDSGQWPDVRGQGSAVNDQWPVVSGMWHGAWCIGHRVKTPCSMPFALCFFLFTLHTSLVTVVAAWAGEFQVGMKGWEFHPQILTIQVGDTVVWLNDDEDPHNVKFEDPSLKGSEERIKPGKKFTLTFEKPGEYNYHCKIHLDQGMKGRVVVK